MLTNDAPPSGKLQSHDGRKEARALAITMFVFLLIILTLRAIVE